MEMRLAEVASLGRKLVTCSVKMFVLWVFLPHSSYGPKIKNNNTRQPKY